MKAISIYQEKNAVYRIKTKFLKTLKKNTLKFKTYIKSYCFMISKTFIYYKKIFLCTTSIKWIVVDRYEADICILHNIIHAHS